MKLIRVFFSFLLPFLLRVYQKVQCFILFGLKYIVVVRWGEHRIKVEQWTCSPLPLCCTLVLVKVYGLSVSLVIDQLIKACFPMWKIQGWIPLLSFLSELVTVDFVKPSKYFNFLDFVGVIIMWLWLDMNSFVVWEE